MRTHIFSHRPFPHPTSSLRTALAVAGVGVLLLTACGDAATDQNPGGGAAGACEVGSTDCDDTPQGEPDGSMNMCAPGVPDCNDTAVEEDIAADCEATATTCDDAVPAEDDAERMNPSITIVQAFADPSISSVEMAPGTMPDAYRLFLQEAIVDGNQIHVSFAGSEAPCFAVDHAEATQDDDMVVITVWGGRPDPAADCSGMEYAMQSVTVVLDADLGSRLLLDASRMNGADNA